MKKIIPIVSIIMGALLIVQTVVPMIISLLLRMHVPESASIGIIGGADGPTSIMIAGRVGNGSVLLIGVGIWGYRKNSGK